MTNLQLCAEDHRWLWKAFFNCASASAGLYLFLYSLWFLVSRLDLVGVLPVVVHLTYMTIISICFPLFCGSVGVLCSLFDNNIGDEGAKAIVSALMITKTMQRLELRSNQNGGEGAIAFAGSVTTYNILEQLHLENYGFRGEGANALAGALAENNACTAVPAFEP